MLFGAVRRFVTLSKHVGVKGSDPSVKELMVILRRSRLSSSQISELSGWKWSSTLVRQYTKNWGGVERELDTQRKTIMTPLRNLASSNYDIRDIENYLKLENSVKAKGSNLEEIAELNSVLRNLDLYPREVERLVTISRELLEQNLPLKTVTYWITLDQALIEHGLNKEARKFLFELCHKYSGINEILNAVRSYNDLNEILSHKMNCIQEVERLSGEKEQLDIEINRNREMVNASRNATIMGYDDRSLLLITFLAQNLGGPYKVANAIKKYESLNEIDEEIRMKRASLENMNRNINTTNGLTNAYYYTLKETEEVYERNTDVRQVVQLLVNPRDLMMDRIAVVGLLTKVLDSSIKRLDEPSKIGKPSDPMWKLLVESIKTLSARLHQINKVKN